MTANVDYQKILSAISSPLNDRDQYLKDIQSKLGSDPKKVIDFLKWRTETTITSAGEGAPKRTINDFMSSIQKIDFRQGSQIADLDVLQQTGNAVDLPLAKDGVKLEYIIRTGQIGLEIQAPSGPPQGVKIYPTPTALVPKRSMPATTGPPLPKYIYQIGRLFIKRQDAAKPTTDQPYQRTPYVVVIDAATPAKSLWIVYDYTPYTDMGDRLALKLDSYAPEQALFASVKTNFDIAQILPDVKDWNKMSVDALQTLVAATAKVVEPVLNYVEPEKLAMDLAVGWKAAPSLAP